MDVTEAVNSSGSIDRVMRSLLLLFLTNIYIIVINYKHNKMDVIKKYKWVLIAYIIYAVLVPCLLPDKLSYNDSLFWVYLIICYSVFPLILYAGHYFIKYKKSGKASKEIEIVKPPKGEKNKSGSWSLLEFAKEHGRMKVHRNNHGLLDMCAFVNDDGLETKVYVAKPLKDYSVEDIQKEEDELSIITLNSGVYCLCKKWEDVKL